MKKDLIVSIGEIVWDHFGDERVIGGAPLNAAYHIAQQGWPVKILSRIGVDELGSQTIEHIEQLGLSTTSIQRDPELKTGTVIVKTDTNNEPFYDITSPSAWDSIAIDEVDADLFQDDFHLVFGTLAQRSKISRDTINKLWKRSKTTFYDVNLRPPFTRPEFVEESLAAATVVKINLEELEILGKWFLKPSATKEDLASQLIDQFGISLVAVTEGGQGAWLTNGLETARHPGFPVSVSDTVGSGDGFFAQIITGYLGNVPLLECLTRANKMGSFIASQKGATPYYKYKEIMAEIETHTI